MSTTDERTDAVLRRYVADASLTELPITIGLAKPSVARPDALSFLIHTAIDAAAASSKLLRSHYDPSAVSAAVNWCADVATEHVAASPMRTPALADQIAYYLLRVCARAREALAQLDDAADSVAVAPASGHADAGVIRVERE